MGRIQEREAAKKEKNALSELCKVQRKFMPDLFELFEKNSRPTQSVLHHLSQQNDVGSNVLQRNCRNREHAGHDAGVQQQEDLWQPVWHYGMREMEASAASRDGKRISGTAF